MNVAINLQPPSMRRSPGIEGYFCGHDGVGLHWDGAGSAFARFKGLTLRSVFQPILDSHTQRPVAFEALLRATDADGSPLAPPDAFARPQGGDIVTFDRLCRTVHALNFARQALAGDILFLNVDARHLLSVGGGHGATFEALLAQCGLTPDRVVLEILESGIDDLGHLAVAVEAYQRRGYRIALDDFGCRHSNFDRLWHLTPDIVKLDRSLIDQATHNRRARLILPRLVELIHSLGAQVVCEGVETAEQHRLAADAGADLVQGYHYARPAAVLPPR